MTLTRHQQYRAGLVRRIRARRLAAGLCTLCGKRKPQRGKTCNECRKSRTIYYHNRVADGICPCGAKLVDTKRCRECLARSQIVHYQLVAKVINHYGGKCACCGRTDVAVLTIDHIDGGGNKHARVIGRGVAIYRWLKRNNFPEGFQVLCANCNHGRARNGGVCPHIHTKSKVFSNPTQRSRWLTTAVAIQKYGGACKCGESQPLFLCLDHLNNDGGSHRRQIGSKMMVVWARQSGYPPIFQVLCDNCNLAKSRPFLSKQV